MADTVSPHSRLQGWTRFVAVLFLIWVFGWVVGPYLENTIPTYRQITRVVEDRGIDSAAYMYTDQVGSYEGEYYLTDSFKHSKRDDYGFTKSFFAGVVLCFVILWIGWRYVM